MAFKAFSALIVLACLSPVATALPSANVGGNPDNCLDDDDLCWIVDVGYYSDKDCTQEIPLEKPCISFAKGISGTNGKCGADADIIYACADANAPLPPFFAKVKDVHPGNEDVQVVFTEDQSCPPSGPGAVFATLVDNDNCVQINRGGSPVGITVYPNGGAQVERRGNDTVYPGHAVAKRANAKCSGFRIDSQQSSTSQSVQVSVIVDCTNGFNPDGSSAPCTITKGQQHTESVSTSYSLSVGGTIEEAFNFGATFGMEYTESSTTSIMEGLTVAAGQKGYLSAYSAATLFKGAFTGCDSGDAEQPGETLAIKKDGFTYIVVNTGA